MARLIAARNAATPPEAGTATPEAKRIAAVSCWYNACEFLREQWIFAALLGLVCCGDVLTTMSRGGSALIVFSQTGMSALAVLAWRYPVICALAAAGAMSTATFMMWLCDVVPHSLGVAYVLPAENAAALLIVFYLCWKAPRRRAMAATSVLLLSCVLVALVRSRMAVAHLPSAGQTSLTRSLGFGALQLFLAAGTGMYLRGRLEGEPETRVQRLLRRQWPAMAMLAVLLFGDFVSVGGSLARNLDRPLSCLAMAIIAVVAPVRWARAAQAGAGWLAASAVLMSLLGEQPYHFVLRGIPVTDIASGMLLVGYATRYAQPSDAARSTTVLVCSAVFALLVIPDPVPLSFPTLITSLMFGGLLLIVSIGSGMYLRARDTERAKSVQAAIERVQQTERFALARELHDVVAHHINGIVVQAQAAQVVGTTNPPAARQALGLIASSGTDALAAMRKLVGTMRGVSQPGAQHISELASTDLVADLEAVVARVNHRATNDARPWVGLTVDLGCAVPQEVARSALRLVQESITNSRKHASGSTEIQVSVRRVGGDLHVRVHDDGVGARPRTSGSGGYGLVGMRERVELLGGRFAAGPEEGVGWRVEAWLPLGSEASSNGASSNGVSSNRASRNGEQA